MQYTMRLENGTQYGPVELETICGWAREKRVPKSALLVPADGGEARSVLSVPELSAIIEPQAPPTLPGPMTPAHADSGVSVLIPYRNRAALTAYYLGIFAFIPGLGIVLGLAAFVLGILGLRARRRNPEVHGTAHAWIGIIIGGGLALVQIGLGVLMLYFASRP